MNTSTSFSIKNLSVCYRQEGKIVPVLKDISFSLGKGELLTLLGESGSGKSTCGKAIMGLLPPSAQVEGGTVHLGESTVLNLRDCAIDWSPIRGRRIAMVYQDAMLALNPVRTIGEHFYETMGYHKLGTPKEIKEKSKEILKLLGFEDPERILSSYSFQLSGGMCQRVYIALILCLQPDVLIADEPTSALDMVSQNEVLSLLQDVKERFQLSILLITHDIGVAYHMSDRILVLEKGEIVEQGQPDKVLCCPEHAYTKALVSARELFFQPCGVKAQGEALLRVQGLYKTFGKTMQCSKVLDGLSLDVYPHQTIGILGYSGCGKSTLAKCIAGLEQPDAGQVLFCGKDITHLRGKKRSWVCKGIQVVFQNPRASLNPRRTAIELVVEPLKYMKLGSKKAWVQKAKDYLVQVGITGDMQHRRPPQLSTGQCQRIAIARALVVEPELLICDEAVSSLDMSLQAQILKLLKALQKQYGFSILMISHDIRVIRQFCQLVAVMQEGKFQKILPTGKLDDTINNKDIRLLLENEIHISKAV